MNKKIFGVLILLVILLFSQTVFADHCTDCAAKGTPCGRCGYSCSTVNGVCVDNDSRSQSNTNTNTNTNSTDWWGHANNFWSGDTSNVAKQAMTSLDSIVNMIKVIGNLVFVVVTVVLGVKYIWGGVESKASVKDSLTTLVVAAIVFYGWNTISALFLNSGKNNLVFITNSWQTTANSIYNIILYILNFLAVGGLVYIGIKYMMAGAEGRAQLKTKGVPIVLGLVMVYATLTFLNFIVSFTDVVAK